MKKLRLLRFQIQPEILVEENGDLGTLPGPIQPLIVTSAGWQQQLVQFATGGFETMLAELEKRLNETEAVPTVAAPPNRAARRRKGKGEK